MSRAPSESRERRRSGSVHRPLPSRRSSSALEDHSHTAVTRAIYHHAREFLKKRREHAPSQHRGRQAMLAVCQGARAVILESAVVQIILRCVERTKQLQAKQADDKWHTLGDTHSLFGGQLGIETAKRISEALGEMLAGFDGDDDVRSRFLNVAKSFDQSEVSLRQLQQSFGDNLDGLEAMRNNFDRCTEEVIRLVSLLEGDCASMRLQLHRTLKSPRERMSQNLFGGIESLGKGRLVLENIPQSPEDHISGLLNTLEHDLCDTPLTTMVQVAQDVNDHIVRQLSEKGRLDKVRPCRLSFDATAQGLQWVSPARVIEEMFHSLKPCIFESANAMAEVDTDDPDLSVLSAVRSETADLIAAGGLVSPTRPSLDLSFARAQLSKVPHSKASSKESNPGDTNKRKNSRTSAKRFSGSLAPTGSTGLCQDFKRAEPRTSAQDPRVDTSISSDPLSGPLKPSRMQRSRNSDPSVPMASSASSPDLPGLIRKDLGIPLKSVGSTTGNSSTSSQSASAKELGSNSKHMAAESHRGRDLGVAVDSSASEIRMDQQVSSVTAGHAATSHRETSRAQFNSGLAHGNHGIPTDLSRVEAVEQDQIDLQPEKLQQLHSVDAPAGSASLPPDLPGLRHEDLPRQATELHHGQLVHPVMAGSAPVGHPVGHPAGHPGPEQPGQPGPEQPGAGPRLLGTPPFLSKTADLEVPGEDQRPNPGAHGSSMRLAEPRGRRQRKLSEPSQAHEDVVADYSRFMAPSDRAAGYEQQTTGPNPFTGSPLLVTKSKLEERPRRQSLTSEAPFPRHLEPLQPLGQPKLGLPAPMALSGMTLSGSALPPAPQGSLSRQGRATSSPTLMRVRPASLDARYKLDKNPSGLLPTLKPLDGQAMVGQAPLHHRKASPARSIGSAGESQQLDHEMLR